MADKAISELIAANQVTPTDLFVLEQSGTAKKLTGQILENWLVSFADGHGGIQSIVKKSTSGLVDTYRITLADTTTFDFLVTNGKSINSISKTSTSGLVDTYTIRYNDNTSGTFTVTNGAKGDKGDNQYVWIKYASQEPTASSHSMGDVADNWIGIYSGESATAPNDWTQYEWFQIKGEKGDTGEAARLTDSSVEYQAGDSGTIIPSGAWSESVPVVAQGRYMWTRTTTTFNTGSSVVSYSVSRMGIDGNGSVSSVAGISPNPDGNVSLSAENVGALPSAGGTMTGELNMNGQKLTGLNTPSANSEAATKGYVDTAINKIDVSSQISGKVDKTSVVNNFTTTEEGFVADARALKTLNESKTTMELLWENNSPTSSFSTKTISVDLTNWEEIIVFAYDTASDGSLISEYGKKGKTSRISVSRMYTKSDVKYFTVNRRFTVSDTGVKFLDAVIANAGTAINDNSTMIPVYIYGVKGVS